MVYLEPHAGKDRLAHQQQMTLEQAASLKYFAPTEWHHPELVDYSFACFLDGVRRAYGAPLILTSDARTPEENAAASGSSPSSLHLKGRAVDLHWNFTDTSLDRLIAAIYRVRNERSTEIELVRGPADHHLHLGLFDDPHHASTVLVSAD